MTLQVHSFFRRPLFSGLSLLQPGSAATPALGQIFARQRARAEESTNRVNLEMKRPYSFRHPFFGVAEVIGEIVGGYLDTDSVLAMASVCKQWNEFLKGETDEGVPKGALAVKTSALREYVQQHGFGALKWERYFGQVERIRLPLELLDILESQCPFFPGEKVEKTHYLFLQPQTVEGKPLTLNSLEELVKNPKKDSGGNPSQYSHFSDSVKDEYGNQKTDKSRWALMTRGLIPESRNKSFDAQCGLIRRVRRGYEVPEGLTVALGVFSRYVAFRERLLSEAPFSTDTRCKELVGDTSVSLPCRVQVGKFSESGLEVVTLPRFSNRPSEELGIVVLRKFYGPLKLD